ncbi:MAG: helix-turn-helix transcriptional regulator [Bacilli bacterium]
MDNLRYLRKNKNLTQNELAKIINVSQQQYGKYESDISEPAKKTIIKLADFFDVSTDEILDRQKTNIKISRQDKKTLLEAIEIIKKIAK